MNAHFAQYKAPDIVQKSGCLSSSSEAKREKMSNYLNGAYSWIREWWQSTSSNWLKVTQCHEIRVSLWLIIVLVWRSCNECIGWKRKISELHKTRLHVARIPSRVFPPPPPNLNYLRCKIFSLLFVLIYLISRVRRITIKNLILMTNEKREGRGENVIKIIFCVASESSAESLIGT